MSKQNEDQEERHPSYGCIRLSHVSGGDERVFMSPLRHQHRIRLSISGARHMRSINSDWHMSDAQSYIVVEMSEQQFAQLICSFNQGNGAPCTIKYVGGERKEAPPVQLKAERHYDEAKAAAKQALDELTSLQHDLDDIVAKLPKAKQEAVRARVGRARQLIGDHMPWIVQMMHEHMDKVVGAAKHEIQAEIGRRLAGAGLQLDGDVAAIGLLPAPTKELP